MAAHGPPGGTTVHYIQLRRTQPAAGSRSAAGVLEALLGCPVLMTHRTASEKPGSSLATGPSILAMSLAADSTGLADRRKPYYAPTCQVTMCGEKLRGRWT